MTGGESVAACLVLLSGREDETSVSCSNLEYLYRNMKSRLMALHVPVVLLQKSDWWTGTSAASVTPTHVIVQGGDIRDPVT